MDTIKTEYLKEKFNELQSETGANNLQSWRNEGFRTFSELGLPTRKNEEWKYTGVNRLFTRDFAIPHQGEDSISAEIISKAAIPGASEMNHLVFVNGKFNKALSHFETSDDFEICTIEEAYNGKFKEDVETYFNKSSEVKKDSIHALNTSFMYDSLFIKVKKGHTVPKPVYLNHIFDTTQNHLLASPRSLIIVEEAADVSIIESYYTHGSMDSFSNEVVEIIAKEDCHIEAYKIQNDNPNGNHVGTTNIRQVGKCLVNTVVISLNGGMIRNNTDIIMEKDANEAHMYGLYFLKGHTHVDNHTLVDNQKPLCFSNELYKGIVDDYATGVFSGKIIVRPDAQKINAYQSNKNILLSATGSVNSKPQLEIYADDVKCSHGCTVGRLDEEAMFYLRARGIDKDRARAILLKAFADDIVDHIKLEAVKEYVEGLIAERLELHD
ncbi:MAG: Fe-S cluster assembly protein SufD [Chitinophagaceae bacterium]|nr:Fe-S cluster assembly protein SufD [Chitinophagaceae bacterium]